MFERPIGLVHMTLYCYITVLFYHLFTNNSIVYRHYFFLLYLFKLKITNGTLINWKIIIYGIYYFIVFPSCYLVPVNLFIGEMSDIKEFFYNVST